MTAPDDMGTGPVIRDHRRIDPVTGQPKRGKHAASQPAGTTGAGRAGGPGGPARHGKASDSTAEKDEAEVTETESADLLAAQELRTQLAERTADLQRLQAEYANYRKRVDRDRATVREHAVAGALIELLPVLDAISQAREHGELSGGFKSVADSLQAATGKLGLVSYGQRGDAFDPKIHEGHLCGDLPARLQGGRADTPPGPGGGRGASYGAGRKQQRRRVANRRRD